MQPAGGAAAQRDTPGGVLLLGACALAIALWFVPYAGFVTYPLRLLGTFLHEGGHALAALLTGGTVAGMAIHPDGSGVTFSAGGARLAILPAGYLGAAAYGALLLALVRRGWAGRRLLLTTGVLIGLLTLGLVRPWDNPSGFIWGVLLAAALVCGARFLAPRPAAWAAAFVGVQCALNALWDLRTLLYLSLGLATPAGGGVTDAAQMARLTLVPAPVWATLWIALSLVLLWVAAAPPRPRRSRPESTYLH
jgi:hypothetical protein